MKLEDLTDQEIETTLKEYSSRLLFRHPTINNFNILYDFCKALIGEKGRRFLTSKIFIYNSDNRNASVSYSPNMLSSSFWIDLYDSEGNKEEVQSRIILHHRGMRIGNCEFFSMKKVYTMHEWHTQLYFLDKKTGKFLSR